MEWVLLVLGGGAAVWGGQHLWVRRKASREDAAILAAIVKLCDEDVTLLGEQLRRLDEVPGALGEAARADYQTALDGYEAADRRVRRVESPEDVAAVTGLLNDARYALACAHARVAGEPVPEKRAPCFFNPQHGPSAEDVMFTPRVGGTKRVPACAQDAVRVKAGEQPEVRTFDLGGRAIRGGYKDALAASQVLDAKYHEAAIRAGAYGGMPQQTWGFPS